MREFPILAVLLMAACTPPPLTPPPAPTPVGPAVGTLPTPIFTPTPVTPRLPAATGLRQPTQQELDWAIRGNADPARIQAADPHRPRPTGEPDVTSSDLMGDPSLPVMPSGPSPIWQRR